MKTLSYIVDLGLFFLLLALDVPWIIAAVVSTLVGAGIRALGSMGQESAPEGNVSPGTGE